MGELSHRNRVGSVDVLALNIDPSTRDSIGEIYTGLVTSETLDWTEEALSRLR